MKSWFREITLLGGMLMMWIAHGAEFEFPQDVDLSFIEKYAYSTNRAELISQLKAETPTWAFYTLLNYQVEGKIDEAEAFYRQLCENENLKGVAEMLAPREAFLAFDAHDKLKNPRDPDKGRELIAIIENLLPREVRVGREVQTKPDSLATPTCVDQKSLSFDCLWKEGAKKLRCLENNFWYVCLPEVLARDTIDQGLLKDIQKHPLDAPGCWEAFVKFLKKKPDFNLCSLSALTQAQLDDLCQAHWVDSSGKAFEESPNYIYARLQKLCPTSDERDETDQAVKAAWLGRILDFARTLPPKESALVVATERALLEADAKRGIYTNKVLLISYLNHTTEDSLYARFNHSSVFNSSGNIFEFEKRPLPQEVYSAYEAWEKSSLRSSRGRENMKDFPNEEQWIKNYLLAFCREEGGLKAFEKFMPQILLQQVKIESDLLSGCEPTQVDTSIWNQKTFDAFKSRVELNWDAGNPSFFNADDLVSLKINVKNVPHLSISFYAVDTYKMLLAPNGILDVNIDLDGCCPNYVETREFKNYSPFVRHIETVTLPPETSPGVYVVDCSGGGISSRALIYKGDLLVVENRDQMGHIFTVMDERGKILKDAQLRFGSQSFRADDNGQIHLPYATDEGGERSFFIRAGGRAKNCRFIHLKESYKFTLSGVLPAETIIPNQRAKLLLMPKLFVGDERISLSAAEDVSLVLTLNDCENKRQTETIKNFGLSDTAESVYEFIVPERLVKVKATINLKVLNHTTGEYEPLSSTCEFRFNGNRQSWEGGQVSLCSGESGCVLEFRGCAGEPLVDEDVTITFKHRAFRNPISNDFKTDAAGQIHLGSLSDIDEIEIGRFGCKKWKLQDDTISSLPATFHLAAGESLSMPVKLRGAWHKANELAARVSLVSLNGEGVVLDNWIQAVQYEDGCLRISDLPPGDYKLYFRAEDKTINLKVVKRLEGTPKADVLVGAKRLLRNVGESDFLRLTSVSVDSNRVVRARVNRMTKDVRVHILARRYRPPVELFRHKRFGGSEALYWELASSRPRNKAETFGWQRSCSQYLSGRDLGDEMRYILDRRTVRHQPGVMLDKPTRLVNPVSKGEKSNYNYNLDWNEEGVCCKAVSAENVLSCKSDGTNFEILKRDPNEARFNDAPCFNFLPNPAGMFCNLRPNDAGEVVFRLPANCLGQEIEVVAVNETSVDRQVVRTPLVAFEPCDKSYSAKDYKGPIFVRREGCVMKVEEARNLTAKRRTKIIDSVEELYALLCSLCGESNTALKEFEFLVRWPRLSESVKACYYDKYASHEMNFFLYCKDRTFFNRVVLPQLKNKRTKDFMDHWLLGDDLSVYTCLDQWANLNALEKCLLAQREKSMQAQVVTSFSDICAAMKISDEKYDSLILSILGIPIQDDWELPNRNELDYANVIERSPLGRAGVSSVTSESASRAGARIGQGEASVDAWTRLYRPIANTQEWIERGYYQPETKKFECNPFWLDYARAIVKGEDASFLSEKVVLCPLKSLGECLGALAVSSLPFDAAEATRGLCFREREEQAATNQTYNVRVIQQFYDGDCPTRLVFSQGGLSSENQTNGFIIGKSYVGQTLVLNLSGNRRRLRVCDCLPEGAVLCSERLSSGDEEISVEPYSGGVSIAYRFYFPFNHKGMGLIRPVWVLEKDSVVGASKPCVCPVTVPREPEEDHTSWDWISKNGTDEEVLEFVKKANLYQENCLWQIGWRLEKIEFFEKLVDILRMKGFYEKNVWCRVLREKEVLNYLNRVREILAWQVSHDSAFAQQFGPLFESSLLSIKPETLGEYEHKEYWPLINPRVHKVGDKRPSVNEALITSYRNFLNLLALKPQLETSDRLDAAVFLLAQDRVDEAAHLVASVSRDTVETKMTYDYLKAYLAFSALKPEEARRLAEPYQNMAAVKWRNRFRTIIAQADEIAGCSSAYDSLAKEDDAVEPTLSLAAIMQTDGVPCVKVTGSNLSSCTLKAYPTDMEVLFSKAPFACETIQVKSMWLRPAWTKSVVLDKTGTARVTLPKNMRNQNLMVVAEEPSGRAEAQVSILTGSLDVQIARAKGEIRVCHEGRPVPNAYVKVYARYGLNRGSRFYKDGYTDLRGRFDYAAVSADGKCRPSEFAVLVMDESFGVKTFTVPAPLPSNQE